MRKLLMNCDQVFDVLTRGPFPTGDDSDEAVERHLRACHECRQLAEALQPAVELLHESLSSEQASDLPAYQGALTGIERSVATAVRARPQPLSVRELVRVRTAERRQIVLANVAQFAAALVLVLAIGMLGWNLIATADFSRGQRELLTAVLTPSGPTTVHRLSDRGLMTLASLNLPARCFPGEALIAPAAGGPNVGSAAIDQDALRCCTECHHSGQADSPASRMVAAMQRSCVACHSL